MQFTAFEIQERRYAEYLEERRVKHEHIAIYILGTIALISLTILVIIQREDLKMMVELIKERPVEISRLELPDMITKSKK